MVKKKSFCNCSTDQEPSLGYRRRCVQDDHGVMGEERVKAKRNCPKHTTASFKQTRGCVMAWACMAATGAGSLVLIDDVTADGSSRMNP